MKVYIVEEVVDDECLCKSVIFITASEKQAQLYVEKHNEKLEHLCGAFYNSHSYREVELQDFDKVLEEE